MMLRCFCCGRREDECPGGIWTGPYGPGRAARPGDIGICVYCTRAAIRAFNESPDLPPAEPVSIFSRRQIDPESAA